MSGGHHKNRDLLLDGGQTKQKPSTHFHRSSALRQVAGEGEPNITPLLRLLVWLQVEALYEQPLPSPSPHAHGRSCIFCRRLGRGHASASSRDEPPFNDYPPASYPSGCRRPHFRAAFPNALPVSPAAGFLGSWPSHPSPCTSSLASSHFPSEDVPPTLGTLKLSTGLVLAACAAITWPLLAVRRKHSSGACPEVSSAGGQLSAKGGNFNLLRAHRNPTS